MKLVVNNKTVRKQCKILKKITVTQKIISPRKIQMFSLPSIGHQIYN